VSAMSGAQLAELFTPAFKEILVIVTRGPWIDFQNEKRRRGKNELAIAQREE
jgi:hypothetical protein